MGVDGVRNIQAICLCEAFSFENGTQTTTWSIGV